MVTGIPDAVINAIRDGKPQYVFFSSKSRCITNEDICIDGSGITLTEDINPDEDLTMGKAVSASLSFQLINDDGLWNDYGFDEEIYACIAVKYTNVGYTIPDGANCRVYINSDAYVGYDSGLTYNGEAVTAVTHPVKFIWWDKKLDFVLALNTPQQMTMLRASDNSVVDNSFDNAFMKAKISRMMSEGCLGVARDGYKFFTFGSDKKRPYYYGIPLGYFFPDKPNVMAKRLLNIQCYDRMSKLDETFDGDDFEPSNLQIRNIDLAVLNTFGYARNTSTITNGTLYLTKIPKKFTGATYRDIMGWIAEATCSYARFRRDGVREMFWFDTAGDAVKSYDGNSYMDAQPYYYETRRIGKVTCRNSSTGRDVSSAVDGYDADTMDEYLITDNPILLALSSTDLNTALGNILTKLQAMPSYVPVTTNTFSDWAVQAGDMVNVTVDDDYYSG